MTKLATAVVVQALRNKDVLKVDVSYRDASLTPRTAELTVSYSDLPAKDAHNDDEALLVVAHQRIRCRVVRGLAAAAACVARLDRSSAVDLLRSTVDDLRAVHDAAMDDLGDEARLDLTEWMEAAVANAEHCRRLVGHLAVRWDDAWGRLKALESSVAREVPAAAAVYAAGSALFQAPDAMRERIAEVSCALRDMYVARGLETEVLEQYQNVATAELPDPRYQNVVEELEEKIVDDETPYGQSMIKTGLLQLGDSARD